MDHNELDFSALFKTEPPITEIDPQDPRETPKKTMNNHDDQQETKAHVDLSKKYQAIAKTYREQNDMRRRCNLEQTHFLQAIDSNLNDAELLEQAIQLIGLVLDDKAYITTVRKKLDTRQARIK